MPISRLYEFNAIHPLKNVILTLGRCSGFVAWKCLGVAHCKPPPAGHSSQYLLLNACTHISMTSPTHTRDITEYRNRTVAHTASDGATLTDSIYTIFWSSLYLVSRFITYISLNSDLEVFLLHTKHTAATIQRLLS